MVVNERGSRDVRGRQLGWALATGATVHGLSQSRDEQTRGTHREQTENKYKYKYTIVL